MKRNNRTNIPTAISGPCLKRTKRWEHLPKNPRLAEEQVWLIGSFSASVGSVRECVTKGGEVNSSSAVSVGPGEEKNSLNWDTPQKEQGVSNQAQILPACLRNASQLQVSLWLLSQAIKMRTTKWHSSPKRDGLGISESADRHSCWTPCSCQCQLRSIAQNSMLSFSVLSENLQFLPFILLGTKNHFCS